MADSVQQRIDQYLKGELSSKEKTAFEADLKSDAKLAARFAEMKMLLEGIESRTEERDRLSQLVRKVIEAEKVSSGKKEPRQIISIRRFVAAASVLIFLGIGIWILFSPSEEMKLYSQYISAIPQQTIKSRSRKNVRNQTQEFEALEFRNGFLHEILEKGKEESFERVMSLFPVAIAENDSFLRQYSAEILLSLINQAPRSKNPKLTGRVISFTEKYQAFVRKSTPIMNLVENDPYPDSSEYTISQTKQTLLDSLLKHSSSDSLFLMTYCKGDTTRLRFQDFYKNLGEHIFLTGEKENEFLFLLAVANLQSDNYAKAKYWLEEIPPTSTFSRKSAEIIQLLD